MFVWQSAGTTQWVSSLTWSPWFGSSWEHWQLYIFFFSVCLLDHSVKGIKQLITLYVHDVDVGSRFRLNVWDATSYGPSVYWVFLFSLNTKWARSVPEYNFNVSHCKFLSLLFIYSLIFIQPTRLQQPAACSVCLRLQEAVREGTPQQSGELDAGQPEAWEAVARVARWGGAIQTLQNDRRRNWGLYLCHFWPLFIYNKSCSKIKTLQKHENISNPNISGHRQIRLVSNEKQLVINKNLPMEKCGLLVSYLMKISWKKSDLSNKLLCGWTI